MSAYWEKPEGMPVLSFCLRNPDTERDAGFHHCYEKASALAREL